MAGERTPGRGSADHLKRGSGIWQRPLPIQRQDSNKNDFIDKEFITRIKDLPNMLPEGLEWLDYRPEMCPTIAEFYHRNFMLGTGPAPQQFVSYIKRRMRSNPAHLILMLGDTNSTQAPDVCTGDGRDAKLVGMMLSEAFDLINQGKKVPVIAIGGLAIDERWRGMGLVINFVRRGLSRVSGEHMPLFNLKKDRRLYPCAELSVWWYPLKPTITAQKMTLFKLNPAPPQHHIQQLCNNVTPDYKSLKCRVMGREDVDTVCRLLTKESKKYSLARCWNSEHVARWLLPEAGLQYSYIVTNETNTEDLDFLSFHVTSFSVPGDDTLTGSTTAGSTGSTVTIRVAIPGYSTSHHTAREDSLRFVMRSAKEAEVDYIHGYPAFAYEEVFKNMGFIRNEKEVHYLQMYNWETRRFNGDEIGLGWIQF